MPTMATSDFRQCHHLILRKIAWAILACLAFGLISANAQIYEKVFSFTDANQAAPDNSGYFSLANLVLGRDGNYYGTTSVGGSSNLGTVFRMTPTGVVTTLVNFTDTGEVNKGQNPRTGLIQGYDGNFYGTTSRGGVADAGTIFKMTPAGQLTTLHEFTRVDQTYPLGKNPRGCLIQGSDRRIYGTTMEGGLYGFGTVFKLKDVPKAVSTPEDPNVVTILDFNQINGASPTAGLVQATPPVGGLHGDFYGLTGAGGTYGRGTVFKIEYNTSMLTTLVNFTGNGSANRGENPFTALVQGTDGDFYGTTQFGGTTATGAIGSGYGTVFKVTSTGKLTTLVDFTLQGGAVPEAALIEGLDGKFYGTTQYGGPDSIPGKPLSGKGTVFSIDPKATNPAVALSTLVQFTGSNSTDNNRGSNPTSALTVGSDGNFFGTTFRGGAFNQGTIFNLTPGGKVSTLIDFSYQSPGNRSYARLLQGREEDGDESFYGTTSEGGYTTYGTIFKLTPGAELTTLVSFSNENDPTDPTNSLDVPGLAIGGHSTASLIRTANGDLYGTTRFGHLSALKTLADGTLQPGGGTIFKLSPSGVLTNLYDFTPTIPTTATGGSALYGGLIQASDGNFYGLTKAGGKYGRDSNGTSGYGTLFRMTPQGVVTTLIDFIGKGSAQSKSRGAAPLGELIHGSDGNLYGTTSTGGLNNQGTAFAFNPATNSMSILADFGDRTGKLGRSPQSALVQDQNGDLYGTTRFGVIGTAAAPKPNLGTVFKITPDGTASTLAEFTGPTGAYPLAGLVFSDDRQLYGTTSGGGAEGKGTVFRLLLTGKLYTVYDFALDPLDSIPRAPLMRARDGNLYGTTSGDVGGVGCVYRIIFPGKPNVYPLATTSQSPTSALITLQANPRGAATEVWLEYSNNDKLTNPTIVTLTKALTGFQTVPLGVSLSNLNPGTTYYYRLNARNSFGTTTTPPVKLSNFSTLAPPIALAKSASYIRPTTAQFNGTVNALGTPTKVVFQFGTDGNTFPNELPAEPPLVTLAGSTKVALGRTGLTKGTTYYYRIKASSEAGTVISGVASFKTLTDPSATLKAPSLVTSNSVQLNGTVDGKGVRTHVEFEYTTDSTFKTGVKSELGTPTYVDGISPVFASLSGLTQSTTYYYRIRLTGLGTTASAVLSKSASFKLDTLSGFDRVAPTAPPSATGLLAITMYPPSILSGWRLVGEQTWRASGSRISGLESGSYKVEYRPVPGYLTPLEELVDIREASPTFLDRDYGTLVPPASLGSLGFAFQPSPVDRIARWRFFGEDDSQWRKQGVIRPNLLPGEYLVEFEPIAGYLTPSVQPFEVKETTTIQQLTYASSLPIVGLQPVVIPLQVVNSDPNLPYAYVGQIRTKAAQDDGYEVASGFVVRKGVVATAAHVIFNGAKKEYKSGLQWLFQRDAGTYEPVPQVPNGSYILTSYSDQSNADGSAPASSATQNLDVAALYFYNQSPGRGGYAGYLASANSRNEFLTSTRSKILVGYPIDHIPAANQGRMHATAPTTTALTLKPGATAEGKPYAVYSTKAFTSGRGGSGGPLCVLFEDGRYYPAGIYLGGDDESNVRAIDGLVTDLFDRADLSSRDNEPHSAGPVLQNSITPTVEIENPFLTFHFFPEIAAESAGWAENSAARFFYLDKEAAEVSISTLQRYIYFNRPTGKFNQPNPYPIVFSAGSPAERDFTFNGIVTSPQNVTVAPQAPVTLNVVISETDTSKPPTYQWQQLVAGVWKNITTNGKAQTYTLTNVQLTSSGSQYRVMVTWPDGTQVSDPAVLTVKALSSQTITFAPISTQIYGPGATLTLGATASPSGLLVKFTVASGPGKLDSTGKILSITGVGSIVVEASQDGSATYAAAPKVSRTIVVRKANQRITYSPALPSTLVYKVGLTQVLNASATSGLGITFTVTGPGKATTIGGISTLSITGKGTVTVKATQLGNDNYNAATAVTNTITVK